MSKNFLIYIVLWLLFQLIEINCQMAPFKPSQRYDHTATLIDDKLYILGGQQNDDDTIAGKQFFYLDVSASFDTQELLWHDLTSINIVPSHWGAASVNGGANNSTLFLYGGNPLTNDKVSIYAFNTKTNSWNVPKTTGEKIVKKRMLTGIVDHNLKMYLFGGYNGSESSITICLF